MHPDIKGLECPERRHLPKATWSMYPQSGGHSYVSLTDKGSQLINRNPSKASIGLPRKALQFPSLLHTCLICCRSQSLSPTGHQRGSSVPGM